MPTRRAHVSRIGGEREYLCWSTVFACGYDYLSVLPSIGVHLEGHVPDTEAARAAWQRHGARYLAEEQLEPSGRPIWALKAFGEPTHAD